MSSMKELERSFLYELVYPPQPQALVEITDDSKMSSHVKMYRNYCRVYDQARAGGVPVSQSFIQWHRDHKYDASTGHIVAVLQF